MNVEYIYQLYERCVARVRKNCIGQMNSFPIRWEIAQDITLYKVCSYYNEKLHILQNFIILVIS